MSIQECHIHSYNYTYFQEGKFLLITMYCTSFSKKIGDELLTVYVHNTSEILPP